MIERQGLEYRKVDLFNVSILGRWRTAITKTTFPVPRMVKGFYRYTRRGRTKKVGSSSSDSRCWHPRECLLGLVGSAMVISNQVTGVIHMTSDGKLQPGNRNLFYWLRAKSVSFKLEFFPLIRLVRYACSIKKTKLLNQVGGKGKNKKQKNPKN